MLREAYIDLKYLLNRGYRKSYALDFVANHYRLSKEERYLLARCVFSDEWVEEVRRKLLKPEELAGKSLAVDGFNVLITLESLREGRAILCEDFLVRDLKYQGKYRLNENTGELLKNVARILGELRVREVLFFYGRNVPKSGVVKGLTEKAMEEFGVRVEVRLVKSPDFELKGFDVVSTADTGIIAKVPRVFDLAHHTGKLMNLTPIPLEKLLKV